MQFLRTVFWVAVTVIAIVFAMNNWKVINVRLWGDVVADVQLPALLLGTFFLGLLPPWLTGAFQKFRLRRRLDATQRDLDATRAAVAPPVVTPPAVATDPALGQPRYNSTTVATPVATTPPPPVA